MLSFRTNGDFIDFVNIDNTSLQVETIIMSLHNTSKAIGWSYDRDTTRISFRIEDISYGGILISDIDFDGVTMTEQADFKTNIEAMFPGLDGGGSSGYLVYTALLTQAGTDAPVATVFGDNTIGGIVWTRLAAGQYNGTLTGAFTLNKTFIPPFDGTFGSVLPIFLSVPGDSWYNIKPISAHVVRISFYDNLGDFIEWSTTGMNVFIEIRVYP